MIRASIVALCLAAAACAASPPPEGPPSLAAVPPSYYRYRTLLPRLPQQSQPARQAPEDKRDDEIMRRLDAIEADLKTLRESTEPR